MIVTPWGYELADVDSLPPILTVSEFEDMVPGLSSTPEQMEAVLASASAAVRDWCGWHVAPSLACTWIGDGDGACAFLPCMGVTDVASVFDNGHAVSSFEWRSSGIVRRTDGHVFSDGWRSLVIGYTAGYGSAAIGQVVAQLAANALVASPGVAEEHAGNVGITYNRTGNGVTGGVRLLDSDKETLSPYRIVTAGR